MRRTPAAPAKAATAAAAVGAEEGQGSGGEEPVQAPRAAPPTHSLWMLSRKFVRLLLTTQVRMRILFSYPSYQHALASFIPALESPWEEKGQRTVSGSASTLSLRLSLVNFPMSRVGPVQ